MELVVTASAAQPCIVTVDVHRRLLQGFASQQNSSLLGGLISGRWFIGSIHK